MDEQPPDAERPKPAESAEPPSAEATQPTEPIDPPAAAGGRMSRMRALTSRPRGQTWVIAGAAALLVLVGASGFALGRTTDDGHGDDHRRGPASEVFDHGDSPFGDDHGGPGGGQPMPGFGPNDGPNGGLEGNGGQGSGQQS